MTKKRQRQRFMSLLSGKVRTDYLEGREHWVVPVTMLVEGVLNGNGAPEPVLYPRQVIRNYDKAWNNKPIVVYHPQDATGRFRSADSPNVLSKQKVGIILHTKTKNGKQQAEAWIEKSRAREVDPRIEIALRNRIQMEVSTGLFSVLREKSGEFQGKPYGFVVHTLEPDHLALLPDQIGACSLKDGCGLLVNGKKLSFKQAQKLQEALETVFSNNGKECTMKCVTRRSKRLAVNKLISSGTYSKEDRKWLESLPGKQLSKIFTLSNNQKDPEDDDEEDETPARRRKVANRQKQKTLQNKKVTQKSKKKIANSDSEEEDEDESRSNPLRRKKVANKSDCACSRKLANKKSALLRNKKSKKTPFEQWMQTVPSEYREFLTQSVSEAGQVRSDLIEAILENENNQFEEDELAKMNLPTLKKLYGSIHSSDEEEGEEGSTLRFQNYLGNVGAGIRNQEEDSKESPLEMPSTFSTNEDRKSRKRRKQSA